MLTIDSSQFLMTSKIYHIELDYILIEKIVMRVVVAALAYSCGFGL